MGALQDFRTRHPEFDELTDFEIADGLRRKFSRENNVQADVAEFFEAIEGPGIQTQKLGTRAEREAAGGLLPSEGGTGPAPLFTPDAEPSRSPGAAPRVPPGIPTSQTPTRDPGEPVSPGVSVVETPTRTAVPPGSTSTETPSIFTEALETYPVLRDLGIQFIDSTKSGQQDFRKIETFPADERDNPRPGRPTIEQFDPNLTPQIIAAESLHLLKNSDPTVKELRAEFVESMTDEQRGRLRDQYDAAREDFGESRPFEQWAEVSGLDQWFGGFIGGVWPADVYTEEQLSLFQRLDGYLRGGTEGPIPGVPPGPITAADLDQATERGQALRESVGAFAQPAQDDERIARRAFRKKEDVAKRTRELLGDATKKTAKEAADARQAFPENIIGEGTLLGDATAQVMNAIPVAFALFAAQHTTDPELLKDVLEAFGPLEQTPGEASERRARSVASGAVAVTGGIIGFLGNKTNIEALQSGALNVQGIAEGLMPRDPAFIEEVGAGFGSSAVFWVPGVGIARAVDAIGKVSHVAALWAGAAASGVLEAMAEAGITFQSLIDSGIKPEEAERRADEVFIQNATVVSLFNRFGLFGQQATQFARVTLTAASEGVQEFFQQIIGNVAETDPLLQGAGKATAIGAIVGGATAQATPGGFLPTDAPPGGPPGGPPPPTPEEQAAIDADQPTPPPTPPGPLGEGTRTRTAFTPRGQAIETEFAVVDQSELITSHDDQGNVNPEFPTELQPRDRSKDASQVQITKIAGNLNPALLGESQTVTDGAPIVGDDLVVESGNARVLAIRRALASEDGAQAYREFLRDNAESFGLGVAEIDAVADPVLVRIRRTDLDRAEFTREANESTGLELTPAEAARKDAARLTDDDLSLFNPDQSGDPLAASNQTFINRFLQALGPEEAAKFIDDQGKGTKQLRERINSAIFARVYGDDRLIALQAEAADPAIRNILTALQAAAPAFAKAKAIDENLGGLNIPEKITDAVQLIRDVQARGGTLEQLLEQGDLFGEADAETLGFARFIAANNRSAERMGRAFSTIAEFLQTEIARQQTADIFGDAGASLPELIAAANRKIEEANAAETKAVGVQGDIFGANPPRGTTPPGAEQPPTAGDSGGQPPGQPGAAAGGAATTPTAPVEPPAGPPPTPPTPTPEQRRTTRQKLADENTGAELIAIATELGLDVSEFDPNMGAGSKLNMAVLITNERERQAEDVKPPAPPTTPPSLDKELVFEQMRKLDTIALELNEQVRKLQAPGGTVPVGSADIDPFIRAEGLRAFNQELSKGLTTIQQALDAGKAAAALVVKKHNEGRGRDFTQARAPDSGSTFFDDKARAFARALGVDFSTKLLSAEDVKVPKPEPEPPTEPATPTALDKQVRDQFINRKPELAALIKAAAGSDTDTELGTLVQTLTGDGDTPGFQFDVKPAALGRSFRRAFSDRIVQPEAEPPPFTSDAEITALLDEHAPPGSPAEAKFIAALETKPLPGEAKFGESVRKFLVSKGATLDIPSSILGAATRNVLRARAEAVEDGEPVPDEVAVQPGPEPLALVEGSEGLLSTGTVPTREGGANFTIIIRSPLDPESRAQQRRDAGLPAAAGGKEDAAKTRRLMGRGKGAKKDRPVIVGEAVQLIRELLQRDGKPRTFNAIGIELFDRSADILGGTPIEEALWELVGDGIVAFTPQAPVLFVAMPRPGLGKGPAASVTAKTVEAIKTRRTAEAEADSAQDTENLTREIARIREQLDPKRKTAFPVSAEQKDRQKRQLATVNETIEAHPTIVGAELENVFGKFAIISPDTISPGLTRVTFFDKDGISGHEVHDNAPKALLEAARQGFFNLVPGKLDELFPTEPFQKGLEAAERIRKANEESFRGEEQPPEVKVSPDEDRDLVQRDDDARDDAKARHDEAKEAAGPEPREVTATDKKAIVALRKSAEGLQKQIDEKLDPAVGDQNMTPRRARIAESMRADGRLLEKLQTTLLALSDALQAGVLPDILLGIKGRPTIEMLRRPQFPVPTIRQHQANDMKAAFGGIAGLSEARTIAERAARTEQLVLSKADAEVLRKAVTKAKKAGRDDPFASQFTGVELANESRARKAGLNDQADWDAARAAIDALEAVGPTTDTAIEARRKFDELKRGLVGEKGIGIDFFPTPPEVATDLVERADAQAAQEGQPGDSVLEPSAGSGNIIEAMAEMYSGFPDITVTALEQSAGLVSVLRAQAEALTDKHKITVKQGDFLEYTTKHNVIVMNPPFTKNKDIDHVRHAWDLLEPGGRLVAVMSEHAFIASGKKETEFREWLDGHGGTADELEGGELADKRVTQRSNVKGRIVQMDKDAGGDIAPGITVAEERGTRYVISEPLPGGYEDGRTYNQQIPEVTSISVSGLKATAGEVRSVSASAAKAISLDEPIEVSLFKDGDLRVTDGHHRVAAARQSGRETLPVKLQAINATGRNINKLIAALPQVRDDGDGQLDLFAPEGKAPPPRPKTADKPAHKPRVKQVRTGTFHSSIDTVNSISDALHVIAPHRKDAQESFIALVTNANGKILRIIRHSIGGVRGTTIKASVVIGEAASTTVAIDSGIVAGAVGETPGAVRVWFAHNHPSGNVSQSAADLLAAVALANKLQGTGVKMEAFMVVAPGSKSGSVVGVFPDGSLAEERFVTIPPGRRTIAIPVTERRIRRISTDKPFDRGPTDASTPERAEKVLKSHPGNGVLLIDNQRRVVRWVPMTIEEMGKLRTGDISTGASRLAREIVGENASIGMAKVVGTEDPKLKALRNVGGFFLQHGMIIEDAFIEEEDGTLTSLNRRGVNLTTGSGTFAMTDPGAEVGPEADVEERSLESVRQLIIRQGGQVLITADIDGDLKLDILSLPRAQQGEGHGSRFMAALAIHADTFGRDIELVPGAPLDFEGKTRPALVKFYQRFGFTEDTGGLAMFRTTTATPAPTVGLGGEVQPITAGAKNRPLLREIESTLPVDTTGKPKKPARGFGVFKTPIAPDHPLRRERILRQLEKDFGVKIYEGRIKAGQKALGFYRNHLEEIRLKDNNDLEVLAHEIAHFMDDIDPRFKAAYKSAAFKNEIRAVSYDVKKLNEGFAEFVRLFLTQEEEAVATAPGFYDEFIRLVEGSRFETGLLNAQSSMHGWFRQGAVNRADSKIGTDKSFSGRVQDIWHTMTLISDNKADRTISSFFDILQGVKILERETTGNIDDAELSPYKIMRLVAGIRGVVRTVFRRGTLKYERNGDIVFGGPGLEDVFKPVADVMDDTMRYFAGMRARELFNQRRENLLRKNEIKALIAAGSGNPRIVQAFKDYQTFLDQMFDFYEASGILSHESRLIIQELNKSYVPFHRIQEFATGDPKGVSRKAFKRLRGGTANVNDIYENIMQSVAALTEMAVQNKAKQRVYSLVKAGKGTAQFAARIGRETKAIQIDSQQVAGKIKGILEDMGIDLADVLPDAGMTFGQDFESAAGQFMTFFTFGNEPIGEDIDSVMFQGKKQYFQVKDPIFLKAMLSFGPQPVNFVLRTFIGFKRVLTFGVTAAPSFMFTNLIRDSVSGWLLRRSNMTPLISSIKGMKDRMAKDDSYWLFLANGGGFASQVQTEVGTARRALEKLYLANGITSKLQVLANPRRLVDWWVEVGSAFEYGTRLAEFNASRRQGKSLQESAFRGREVSTDFGMRGSSDFIRLFVSTVPFMNARLQGLYRFEREAFEKKGRQAVIGDKAFQIARRMMLMLTLPSMALWWLNKDDDRYNDLEPWIKDLHWVILIPEDFAKTLGINSVYLIPKPFELGALGASVWERAAEFMVDRDGERLTNALWFILTEQLNFNLVPQIGAPIWDHLTNENWMGGKVIPADLANVDNAEQFRPWSSDTSIFLGEQVGIPPLLVDHYVKGYLGTMGMGLLMMSDALVEGSLPEAPAKEFSDFPVIRRLTRALPLRRTSYENEFYQLRSEIREVTNTYNKIRLEGRDPAVYLDPAEREVLFNFAKTEREVSNAITALNGAIRRTRLSGVMSPDEKLAEIKRLRRDRNKLFKDATDILSPAQIDNLVKRLERDQ